MNEDVAFERLKDMQREMENSRLWADGASYALGLVALLARRAWVLGGLAMRRAPRRRPQSEAAGS
jgi:hypothetical protein